MPLICDIFWKHRRRYGARRIAIELGAAGEPCGVDRVAKLLKIQGLKALQPRSFRPPTTASRHTLGYSPNLLPRMSRPLTINRIWVADITYLPLHCRGLAYLAVVLDLCARRVIGWSLAEHMTETLVLDALQHAIRTRQPPPGLIHHSDRGGQYAGHGYRGVLRRAAMRQSMSRAANCYDNAFMESCFGTIKTELEVLQHTSHWVAGDVFGGSDGDIHAVGNFATDNTPLVTRHVYSPPLTRMSLYSLVDGRLVPQLTTTPASTVTPVVTPTPSVARRHTVVATV